MNSSFTTKEQSLLITAQGQHSLDLTQLLCRAATDARCQIASSRLSRHGEQSALTIHVSGPWDALARMETALDLLGRRQDLKIIQARITQDEPRPDAVPYVVYVSTANRSDLLIELCQFFGHHGIGLDGYTYDTYIAPQTGTEMLTASFNITLPISIQISWIREQFMDFADALNLDALMEPWRPSPPF